MGPTCGATATTSMTKNFKSLGNDTRKGQLPMITNCTLELLEIANALEPGNQTRVVISADLANRIADRLRQIDWEQHIRARRLNGETCPDTKPVDWGLR